MKLLSEVKEFWSGEALYAGFWYIGTERGVFRVYPGIVLSNDYDPTKRPWYILILSER